MFLENEIMILIKIAFLQFNISNRKKLDMPFSFNFEELKPMHRPTVELSKIIDELTYYDLEAAYQRDLCWAQSTSVNLIKSILAGIPIGTIHLASQTGSDFYQVLDAKQRLSAIKNFTQNKFSVPWEGKNYRWEDFKCDSSKSIYRKFINYTCSIIVYKDLSILQQRDLFETINIQANLNTAEKLYCPNFFGREIIRRFYEGIRHLSQKCRGEIGNNKRFSGIMWCHRICYLSFGPNFDDVFSIRKTDKPNLLRSARRLDDKLCKYLDSPQIESFKSQIITDKVFEDLGYMPQYNALRKLSFSISNILDYKNNLKKKENAIDITDLLTFLMEKIQKGQLTCAMIDDNIPVFFDFYQDYVNAKSDNMLAKHTTDIESINKRKEIFDRLYNQLPIDHGIKNKKASACQKASAILNAPTVCPLTELKINDNNARIEHVNPKSKFSKTNFSLVSDLGNRIKSNLTKKNVETIENYFSENN